MEGTFYYIEGETIRFYMGDVLIGEALANKYMTPVDLVPGAVDEMHRIVTNISRLLQTTDADGYPTNGIFIPNAVHQEMIGSNISFDMPIEEFGTDLEVVMLMDDLDEIGGDYAGRLMISPDDAQEHLRTSLAEMMQMMTGGSVVHTGVFLDSAVEGRNFKTATQSGITNMDGSFSYMAGETVRSLIADVMLGEAIAKPVMTPVDVVPGAIDETHPTVINISR